MAKKKEKVLEFIDIEASEAESSEYSEDLAPSDLEWEDMGPIKESSEEATEEESVESLPRTREEPLSYLPSNLSPKLFLVRVPPGKEYIYFLRIKELKNILSVIYKEELKGYLYVESINKRILQESLKSRHISLIPQNEMTDVFFSTVTFSKYGRIKSGKYKGDTCEIIAQKNNDTLLVKLVPRINNVKQLFNPSEYPCIKNQGYFVYKKDSYKNGFLEKEILARNVIPISKISLEEMQLFEPKKMLKHSQRVKIAKGEFKNEEGRVIRMEINGALVDLNNFGKQFIDFDSLEAVEEEKLDFSVFKKEEGRKINEIMKRRRDPLINKEVIIKKGEYKGYKGIITNTYRETVKVLINTNNKDINLGREDILINEEVTQVPFKEFVETGFRTPGLDYKTPNYRTPGYRTPGMEYKTPGYKTPGMDYKTPSYRTPGADYKTPGSEYKTPAYWTPSHKTAGWEYKTPSKEIKKVEMGQSGLFKGVLISVDGTVKEITDSTDDMFICSDEQFNKSSVKFVSPEKYDTICFMEGDNRGKHGLLVAITGEECVVRLGDTPICCKIYEISKVGNK